MTSQAVERCERLCRRRKGWPWIIWICDHWPRLALDLPGGDLEGFEYLLEKGNVRAIGVSNFLPVHMEALLKKRSFLW